MLCVNTTMGLHTSFDVLSRVVERFESDGRSVRDVEVAMAGPEGGELHATMDVPVSLCPGSETSAGRDLELRRATTADGDGVHIECAAAFLDDLPPAVADAVATEVRSARLVDGGVVLTLELTVSPTDWTASTGVETDGQSTARSPVDDAGSAESEPTPPPSAADPPEPPESEPDGTDGSVAARLAAVRDDSVPPYEDVEYLRALYDSCETFAEMSRHIEMDVAAETVRRYMITADVHRPTQYETSEESPSGPTPEERLVADGVGLPNGLRVEDVVDAVADSVSVLQVQRSLGIDRQATLDLLSELDLLGFVMHRVSDDPGHAPTYEEVATRLREGDSARRAVLE
jgi:hypothetical protein